MRAVLLILILFLSLAPNVFAQQSPQIRRLPPSLERELKLKHGGKIRIIGFTDTLKAQSIIAQSLRDSSSEELDSLTAKDSAIIEIDSSVSLTDKEWLDSMLVQLPEYEKTPEGIRFHYPADVLVETNRKVVPPDTTLPSRMDPVAKEDLPIYGNLPMPQPLEKIKLPRTSVELGAGSPYIPRAELQSLIFSNDVSAIEISGKYFSTTADEPAIKQYWKIGASGNFAFADSLPPGQQLPQLDVSASLGSNKRLIAGEQATLSLANINTGFTIGSLEKLRLTSHAFFSSLNDSYKSGIQESISGINLILGKKIDPLSVEYGIRYETIGDVSTKLLEMRTVVRSEVNNLFQWKLGILYLFDNNLKILPIVEIKKHFSNAFEIGASLEPENKLISVHDLTRQNLFYESPFMNVGITSEPIHLNLFANYFLSLDDEVHAQFRYINRNNELVFFLELDTNKNIIFTTTPLNTRRIEFEFGGSMLAFGKDKLRGSILFRSVSDRDSNITLPYVPTAQVQASYQFGIWNKFIPQIELMNLERPNHSFAFLNLDVRYIFSPAFQIKFRAENILGSAGDFWTGYNEYPRSIWVSAKYAF